MKTLVAMTLAIAMAIPVVPGLAHAQDHVAIQAAPAPGFGYVPYGYGPDYGPYYNLEPYFNPYLNYNPFFEPYFYLFFGYWG